MIMSILIQFSEYIFIQFSHFKGEHPGDDLEDGEIMHKVKDGLNKSISVCQGKKVDTGRE